MSAADSPYQPGQQPAAQATGLSIHLSSNNPFRNRAASPSSIDAALAAPPASPFDDPPPPPRPLSRNPFLDHPHAPLRRASDIMLTRANTNSLSAEDIFDSLTLDDKDPELAKRISPPSSHQRPIERLPAPRRGENQSPGQLENKTQPKRSQEEASKGHNMPASASRPSPFDSPPRKPQRRPRRNSESSVLDLDNKPITEEEKKMIEAKRRERDRRRDGKERSSKPGRPSRRMDIIDQLDATSIYGTGLFHHDGPFDALNPHRNRHSSRRLAPMQAFPKDSLNNSMGGSGPLRSQADHSTFMGHGTDEAFRDYAGTKNRKGHNLPVSSRIEPAIFDPVSRGNMVHGDESYGLGTSTFLEGTPAARSAINRRQVEEAQEAVDGGLQRKKSLAQRIRHINRGPRDFNPSGRMTSPDVVNSKMSPDQGRLGTSVGNESNPFFADFNRGEDGFGSKPRDGNLSPPPIPRRGSGSALERRATTDATLSLTEEAPVKPSGLLGRMKSLKGGRRPKNAEVANN